MVVDDVPSGVGDVAEVVADDDAVGGVAERRGGALDDLLRHDLRERRVEGEDDHALGRCSVLDGDEAAVVEIQTVDAVEREAGFG